MTSTTPLVLLISFWLLVYIRRRYILSSTNGPLLPVTASAVVRRASRVLWTLGNYAEIDLTSPFVLRGRTHLFVDSHGGLVEYLGGSRSESTPPSCRRPAKPTSGCGWDWGSAVKRFYDLGSLAAVAGQTLALGVLWWSLLQLALSLLGSSDPSSITTHNMIKRSPVPLPKSSNLHSELMLRPLIPGINLPLSHLSPIFFSLIVCTTIHELGHAIAAAGDGIPLLSWGYSLILAIPAAFVELASSTTKERTPLVRLRITAAGVYHNLITLAVLFFFSTMSIGRMIWPLFGYQYVENGVVVTDVDVLSPLRPHLIPGSVVTAINDVGLYKSSNHTPRDLWASLLLMDTVEHEKGWCVERHWFEDHSQNCCSFSSPHNNRQSGSCFIPQPYDSMVPGNGWCLDPVPLFEDKNKQRCLSHIDCNASREQDSDILNSDMDTEEKRDAQMCITPHSSADLLRISFVQKASDDDQKLIVWKGPRREVWEQVTVGKYLPRFRIMSVALPGIIELLIDYLRTVSLSLFFINILPIRFLDGGEILSAFLDLILTTRSFTRNNQSIPLRRGDADLEMGSGEWGAPVSPWRRRAQKIEGLVEIMTVCLIVVVSTGGLLVSGVG